ncbi:MAG: hypothetical protein AAF264_00225 [Pseudomonadota bacterium]
MTIEPHSATWRAIAREANQRIASAQKALEARNLPAAETEFERGRIKALRDILGLVKPQPVTPEQDAL